MKRDDALKQEVTLDKYKAYVDTISYLLRYIDNATQPYAAEAYIKNLPVVVKILLSLLKRDLSIYIRK
jgi:hypothetical protein